MEFEQIIQLVEAVSGSGLNVFDYEENHIKLHMERKMPKAAKESKAAAEIHEELANANIEAATDVPSVDQTEVVAPIVGVFYHSPGPEAPSFVKVGDRVEVGQVIGIIEAMKLMNEIQSDVSGVVTEILAADGEGVEYGQPLIRVGK